MAHFENYNYLTTSDACVKCGKCLPDCTIFAINGDEATSPRGFIDLLGAYQRKEIPLDKNAKEIFENAFYARLALAYAQSLCLQTHSLKISAMSLCRSTELAGLNAYFFIS